MITRLTMRQVIVGICLLSLCGCGFKKSYPAKQYYQLSATRTGEVAPSVEHVMRVQPLEISDAFSGKGLVSRIGHAEFESDYYAEFFSSPDQMITEQLMVWLRASGRYRAVFGSASTLTADRVIEGMIDQLYVDRQNPSETRAVLSLQLRFIDDSGRKPEVISTKAYQEVVVVDGTNRAVVEGWNQALESVLTQVERSLIEAD